MRKSLIAFALIALVLLAGCANKKPVEATDAGDDNETPSMAQLQQEEDPGTWQGKPFKVGDCTVEIGQYDATDACGTSHDHWGEMVKVTDQNGESKDFSQDLPPNTRLKKYLVVGNVVYFMCGQGYINGGDGQLSSYAGEMYRLNVEKRKMVASNVDLSEPVLVTKVPQGLAIVCDYQPELVILDPDTLKLKKRIEVKFPKLEKLGGEPFVMAAKLAGNKIELRGSINLPENIDPERYPYGPWTICYNLDTGRFGRLHLPRSTEVLCSRNWHKKN